MVLWSEEASTYHWVAYEAEEGRQRDTLIEAWLDNAKPPPSFGVLNVADLSKWQGGSDNSLVSRLIKSVITKVRKHSPPEGAMSLAAPRSGQAVSDVHLALIHTCWRAAEHDKKFDGREAYRWDACIIGPSKTLNRVEKVTCILHPAYENPELDSHSICELKSNEHRDSNFLIRQIANGYSLIHAHIKIEN